MISIYQYNCPSQYLKDVWNEKKAINPAFSLRSWAKHLGFTNNSALSLMLNGKRPIPKKYIPKFIDSLGISSKDGIYLETLIDLSRERSIEGKEFYMKRLKSLEPQASLDMSLVNSFKLLSNPIHTTLFEMCELEDFKYDLRWIQKKLYKRYTQLEIQNALNILVELGLIEIKNEKIKKKLQHFSTHPDIKDLGVQSYHKAVSEIAKNAVGEQNILERQFSGYAMNIDKKDMEKAKKLIREFTKEFISQIEAKPKKGTDTYQLNLQFFKLTN